jgi:hypothetical protein
MASRSALDTGDVPRHNVDHKQSKSISNVDRVGVFEYCINFIHFVLRLMSDQEYDWRLSPFNTYCHRTIETA